MSTIDEAKETILKLKQAVLSEEPENNKIPSLLREIKSILAGDPTIVTLLQPEEVADIIAGIYKQQGIIMAAPKEKKVTERAAAKAKASKFTLDDL